MSLMDLTCALPTNMTSKVELFEKIIGRSPEYSNDVLYLKPLNVERNLDDQEACAKEDKILVYFGGHCLVLHPLGGCG